MPSPFPGMDPYLEGYLWPDVHQRLANDIGRQLTPLLRPRYVARLAITVIQDETPESDIGILYPDVEILRRAEQSTTEQPMTSHVTAATITPPLTVPLPRIETRIVTVEVRDRAANQLITSIEILSPVNKREPGLTQFRQKRERLRAAGVHLLDIDLIRRGERPVRLSPLIDTTPIDCAPYLATLTRAGVDALDVWPIRLQDKLPVVAVPLHTTDADAPLDLAQALSTVYDEAAYDLSIDYQQEPPPPAFDAETTAWIRTRLSSAEE